MYDKLGGRASRYAIHVATTINTIIEMRILPAEVKVVIHQGRQFSIVLFK